RRQSERCAKGVCTDSSESTGTSGASSRSASTISRCARTSAAVSGEASAFAVAASSPPAYTSRISPLARRAIPATRASSCGDAADVLDAVLRGEAQVLVEAVADVVAVEQVGVPAGGGEALLDPIGDGGLAGARESREPQHAGSLSLLPRACLLVDVHRLPVHVLRAAQREVDQPGADGVVGEAVDEDEAAERAILAVGLERDRPVELE